MVSKLANNLGLTCLIVFSSWQTSIMAVEYEGGVVLGADSRTSSGYVSLGTGRHMGLGTGGHMGLGTGGHMGLGIDVGIWVWALVGCEELGMCLSYCHDCKHPNIPMTHGNNCDI